MLTIFTMRVFRSRSSLKKVSLENAEMRYKFFFPVLSTIRFVRNVDGGLQQLHKLITRQIVGFVTERNNSTFPPIYFTGNVS